MKKYLFSFLMLVPILTMAQSFTSGDLQYWVTSSYNLTVEVAGLTNGMPEHLEIPNTVTYSNLVYKVTGIRENALPNSQNLSKYDSEELNKLKTLCVGDNVTELPQYFLAGNTSVRAIQLGSGLKKIGASAFNSCTSLESIVIPDGVENLDQAVLWNCTNLKSVRLSKSLTSVPQSLLGKCPSLEVIDFGSSKYEELNSMLFSGAYPNLVNITMRNAPPPFTWSTTFPAPVVKNTYLHVPVGCAQAYKNMASYQNFKAILDDVTDAQCADPQIHVSKGRIGFSCATPGVTFEYTVTTMGAKEEVLENEYIISEPYLFVIVQATKSGCEPSNTLTKKVPYSALFSSPDLNGDGSVNTTDVVEIYNYIINGN